MGAGRFQGPKYFENFEIFWTRTEISKIDVNGHFSRNSENFGRFLGPKFWDQKSRNSLDFGTKMVPKSENNFKILRMTPFGILKFLNRGFRPNSENRDLDFEIFEISRIKWPEINFQNFEIFREFREIWEIRDFSIFRDFGT